MTRARQIVGSLLICALTISTAPVITHAYPTPAASMRVTMFAGLQQFGLYRSTDHGATWQEADSGLPPGDDITALAIAPKIPGPVYAGTRLYGVFVSTDNGASWHETLQDGQVAGLAVDPMHPSTVYAATGSSVYKSTNSGQTWTASPFPAGNPTSSLAIDPKKPTTLVVGAGGGALFLSTDGGTHWVQAETDPPAEVSINQVAFDPRRAEVAYAAAQNGLYQTVDGGQTWQLNQDGIPYMDAVTSVAVNPANDAEVLAGSQGGGFLRSTDGGKTWGVTGILPASLASSLNTLLFDPVEPNRVLAGTYGQGLYMSTNGGKDWAAAISNLAANANILTLVATQRPTLPTDQVNPPSSGVPNLRYFPATGHIVRAPFLDFYNQYGGIKIFGLPLTEAFTEHGRLVQYFERAELVDTPGGVQEGALGTILTQGRTGAPSDVFASTSTRLYFPATRHSLSGDFLAFWRNHHGKQLFGLPITEPLYEPNGDGTGRAYLTQYFQNARMEYHPELAGTNNVVTLGLLGRQVLHQRGWL